MTECRVIDGLHVRERTIDDRERIQRVALRLEMHDPLAIPPSHIAFVIRWAGTGEWACNCMGPNPCRHVMAAIKWADRGPRPTSSHQGVA